MRLFLILSIILVIGLTKFSFTQDMNDGQKAIMEFMQPGKMHQELAKMVGEWKAKMTSYMTPDGKPEITDGKSTNEMVMGGRYLITKHTGTVMGMPMEGMNLVAYDNAKQKFYSVWIDNMGTGIALSEGVYDEKTNITTYKGKMTDPMTKGDVEFTETFKIIDENHHVMEMFMMMGSQEVKMMTVEYFK